MNHAGGWMNGMNYGWIGGGMWLWTVAGVLVVVLLVVAISKVSKQ
jgi:hypothetical protein